MKKILKEVQLMKTLFTLFYSDFGELFDPKHCSKLSEFHSEIESTATMPLKSF